MRYYFMYLRIITGVLCSQFFFIYFGYVLRVVLVPTSVFILLFYGIGRIAIGFYFLLSGYNWSVLEWV